MIGNGSCVQSELTSDCWFAPSSAGLGSEQTRVSGFHCTLILFSVVWIYLNHFNCNPAQKSAKGIWSCPELEIELAMLSLHRRALKTQLTRVKKERVFVIIYFAACLSHLHCPGVWGLDLTKLSSRRLIWRGCTLLVHIELPNSNTRV